MGTLDGRVVIVTGGGRGIGRAHCLELAKEGAKVVVNDLGVALDGDRAEGDPADAVVAEIEARGGQAVADKSSVTDWGATRSLVETAVNAFGHLDAVINNAGILRDRMITSLEGKDFETVVAVHLFGTFNLTKHACDYWRSEVKAGHAVSGRIINTTSSSGMFGNVGQAAYAAAKAGIIGLTLTTAQEMQRYDVTCNAVSPVATTRMTSGLKKHGGDSEMVDGVYQPLHPAASSPVVAFLASEESGWLSGQTLRVEGNSVVRMQGWQISDQRYTSSGEGFLQAGELPRGLRMMYGAFPTPFNSPVV